MTPAPERVAGRHMNVNSYVLPGPRGAVVVDGQLCRDDAHRVGRAVAETGLPLAGVVLTHPHPDHYAGVATFAPPGVPVVATRAVADVIRRDDADKAAVVGAMMGEQWPEDRRFPDVLVEDGGSVELGGLELTVTGMGAAESHADTCWQVDGMTFTGDLCGDQHSYLADGHAEQWIATLADLRSMLPAQGRVYPGHGAPGGLALLDAQERYLRTFLEVVDEHLEASPDQRSAAVARAVGGLVEDDSLLFLAMLSVEPLAASRRGS